MGKGGGGWEGRAGEEETNRNIILLGTPDNEFQCEKGGWNREALRLHL